ncbi:MAG TPA: four helix bundle protein [Longimicrobiales bacterium]|nr:four helix bundle protein [Longimicrobiales bacterium]
MNQFNHERLHVYHLAADFVVLAENLIVGLPRQRRHLADQLHRAATSIPLNIAEGAGEFSPKEKVRFYRIPLRPATECASILDLLHRLAAIPSESIRDGRILLLRTVSMLVKLCKREHGTATEETAD